MQRISNQAQCIAYTSRFPVWQTLGRSSVTGCDSAYRPAFSEYRTMQAKAITLVPNANSPLCKWHPNTSAHDIILGGTLGRVSGSSLGVGAVLRVLRNPWRQHGQYSQASLSSSSQSKHGPRIVRGSLGIQARFHFRLMTAGRRVVAKRGTVLTKLNVASASHPHKMCVGSL